MSELSKEVGSFLTTVSFVFFFFLYFLLTGTAAKLLYDKIGERWLIFQREIVLILLTPVLCVIVGLFWPLGSLVMIGNWMCAADKSWCGIDCGRVRERVGGAEV